LIEEANPSERKERRRIYEVFIDGSGVWLDENGQQTEPLYGFLIVKKGFFMEPESFENNPYPPEIVKATNFCTNNQAEYLALKELIEWLPDHSVAKVYSDSMLVVCQIGGFVNNQPVKWECRHPELKVLKANIEARIQEKDLTIHLYWIPREKNKFGKILERINVNARNARK
jgi:ribonuclease HI